eukprot:CAMPEP_0177765600 /NCGR_PEP_ID=MMETSP0491_2-20121128/8078_1 /TAXON_ID=63592 /ORGANISM="Tetraselmis chuii, Strain PLY429" /LENGTH=241 /DNA_ID=CAMNT_0019281959 /DNA_START=141 /DNA_END=866 /DNA_ORIENTATION=+
MAAVQQVPQRVVFGTSHPKQQLVVRVPPLASRKSTGALQPVAASRRELGAAVVALIGTKDPTTVLNAVLSGYGLPTFSQGSDFTLYDEFEDDFTFEFPKKWVSRPNSLREGVYISDFNTADKVTVDQLTPGDDLVAAAVLKVVAPASGQQDDRLEMPNQRQIKVVGEEEIEGRKYTYLQFPSTTITRSGYSIKRRNFAAVVGLDGRREGAALVINASARSDQFNDAKRELLQRIVHSFRVR